MATPVPAARTPARTTARPVRRGALVAHLVVSALLVVLVLFQATIAGRHLYDGADIALHGYVGNASFLLGLVGTALALFGRLPTWLLGVTALTALLMFPQTGLGYLGRDEPIAATWHVPLGVLIFGCAMWQCAGSAQLVLGQRRLAPS